MHGYVEDDVVLERDTTSAQLDECLHATARENFGIFRRLVRPNMLWGWWTKEVANQLHYFYEDFAAGRRPKLALSAPPQHGKQVINPTPVLTTKGWTTHGQLRVGDEVFHPSGQATRVTALSAETEAHCRVELTNGEVIYCHDLHEWTVIQRSRRGAKLRTMETQELMRERLSDGQSEIGKRGHHFMFHLPRVQPIAGVKQRLPVAPYALGAWLGDGTRSKPMITAGIRDTAVVEEFERLGYLISARHKHPTNQVMGYSFCVPGHSLRPELQQLGFMQRGSYDKKYIPDQYLVAPIADRLDRC